MLSTSSLLPHASTLTSSITAQPVEKRNSHAGDRTEKPTVNTAMRTLYHILFSSDPDQLYGAASETPSSCCDFARRINLIPNLNGKDKRRKQKLKKEVVVWVGYVSALKFGFNFTWPQIFVTALKENWI